MYRVVATRPAPRRRSRSALHTNPRTAGPPRRPPSPGIRPVTRRVTGHRPSPSGWYCYSRSVACPGCCCSTSRQISRFRLQDPPRRRRAPEPTRRRPFPPTPVPANRSRRPHRSVTPPCRRRPESRRRSPARWSPCSSGTSTPSTPGTTRPTPPPWCGRPRSRSSSRATRRPTIRTCGSPASSPHRTGQRSGRAVLHQ